MRGWLTELMISTLWFTLIYASRREVEKMIMSLFADLLQILGTF